MAKRKAKRTTRHRKILAKKRMPANVRKARALRRLKEDMSFAGDAAMGGGSCTDLRESGSYLRASIRKAEAAKVSANHPTMRDAKLIAREVEQAKANLGCRTR